MLPCLREALGAAALLLSLDCATAQTTWVVDPGGSGSFTDLGAALAAAGPGDTLILRGGGNYAGAYSAAQPVHLVGEAPRSAINQLNLIHLPGAGTASISNLDLTFASAIGPSAWEGVNLASLSVSGTIATLNRCSIGSAQSSSSGVRGLNGAHVVLTDCSGVGGAAGVLAGMSCLGIPGNAPLILQGGSNASVFGCTLTRAASAFVICATAPAGAAIECPAGSTVTIGASTLSGPIAGPFSVFSQSFGPVGTVQNAAAGVRGTGAAPGGALLFQIETPPNVFAAIALSVDLHTPVPFPPGFLWVDPAQYTVLRIGATGPPGALGVSVSVPPGTPRGLAVTTQGAVLQVSGIVPSLPAGLLVL